jgi:hypothetical protein
MTNEVTSKQYPGLTCYYISYDATDGQAAGRHLTGGRPEVISGKPVVKFEQKIQGKSICLLIATRPDLGTLVEQYNELVAEQRVTMAAAQETKRAAQDAKELPLIEAMNIEAARLRTLIPEGHVEVTVTETGNFDGYPTLEYTVGDVWLNFQDVTVHGWASATRPGAMNSFKSICIASINREKLAEIVAAREVKTAQKAEAENTAKAELEAKYAEAKSTGKPVEIRRFMDDCNDPNEECSSDIVTVYAMPNGGTKSERQHTW